MRLCLDNEVVMSNVIKLLSSKDKQSLKRVSKAVRYAVLSTTKASKITLDSEFYWDREHKRKAGYFDTSPMGVYDTRVMPKSGPTDFLGLAQADMPCLESLSLSNFRAEDLDDDAYLNLAKATWPLKSLVLSDVGVYEGMLDDMSSASWGSTLSEFILMMEDIKSNYNIEEQLGELKFPALEYYVVDIVQEDDWPWW